MINNIITINVTANIPESEEVEGINNYPKLRAYLIKTWLCPNH